MQLTDAHAAGARDPHGTAPRQSEQETATQRASDARPLMLRLAAGEVGPLATRIGWLLFAVLLVIGIGQCFMPVTAQDEGELLVYPWLIAHGSIPYRDIWMMYPPSTYLILAAFFKAGIPGLLAERSLSLVSRVLYILLVNRTLTGKWSRFSWLGVPLASSLLFYEVNADMRAYPWIVGMSLVLLGLASVRNRPSLAALLFFLAGTFRYEFALAGCVALAAHAVLCLPDGQRFWPGVKAALSLATATIAFCLALGLVSGGDALQQTILDPALRISPGRRLPLFPPHFGWWGIPLELAVLAGPLVMVVAGLLLRRPYLAATNLGALMLVQHFLQRADWIYLVSVGAAVVPWMLISLVDLANEPGPGASVHSTLGAQGRLRRAGALALREGTGYVGVAVAGWYLLLVLVLAPFDSPLSPLSADSVVHGQSLSVQAGGNTIIAHDRREAADDRGVIHYLRIHGRPDQRVFVAPRAIRYAIWNMTDLYYVLGLPPASRYLEMNPGVETRADVQGEIIRELHSCTWVVVSAAGYWYEPNSSHVPGSPLLQRFITRHYVPVYANRSYQVLRAKVQRPSQS